MDLVYPGNNKKNCPVLAYPGAIEINGSEYNKV